MRADDDQASRRSRRVGSEELVPRQEWPRVDARSRPHKRGAGAIDEPLALGFRLEETEDDGPEIWIDQRVDDDWRAMAHVAQPLGDPLRASAANLFYRQ
jgi:hypothetical protein